MSYPKKVERNKRLIKLRKQNPKKWSWGALANEFNISRPMALKLFRIHSKVNKVLTKG